MFISKPTFNNQTKKIADCCTHTSSAVITFPTKQCTTKGEMPQNSQYMCENLIPSKKMGNFNWHPLFLPFFFGRSFFFRSWKDRSTKRFERSDRSRSTDDTCDDLDDRFSRFSGRMVRTGSIHTAPSGGALHLSKARPLVGHLRTKVKALYGPTTRNYWNEDDSSHLHMDGFSKAGISEIPGVYFQVPSC